MKSENRARLEWTVRVVKPPYDDHAAFVVHRKSRDGQESRVMSQVWKDGRPTNDQLQLLSATLIDDLVSVIATEIGVRGMP